MARAHIFDRFLEDHQRVLAQLAELEAAALPTVRGGRRRLASEAKVREVVALLDRQFATNQTAEDEIVFEAVEQAFPEARSSIAPLRSEHAELRQMLASLVDALAGPVSNARDERIAVEARDLIDLLRIHIRKEEAAVYRVPERVLSASQIRALEARLTPDAPGRPAPSAWAARRTPLKGELK